MKRQITDPFHALSDPSRREILMLLSRDSLSINSLAENFDMSRPAVSKHVKVLYSSGFISVETIGRERYCILKQDGFNHLSNWISYFDDFWKTRLSNLEKLLNQKAKK